MALRTRHEIADLRRSQGELSFLARVGGESPTIRFRTESAMTPSVDAALAACLMPAMRDGGTLTMAEPLSPRVMRNQREFQAIQCAWSREWEFGDPPLLEVEVLAPVRAVAAPAPTGRVAAFFSGGVDSWATVLGNPDLTDLIFVRGIDILERAEHQAGLADRVEERLREAAERLGLTLHVVHTNIRELSDPLARWEAYYGSAVTAVALFLEPLFDRVLIAGDSDYEVQVKLGANWLVDQLWSTEGLEIVDDGGDLSRIERTRRVAAHPVAQQTLRVCWQNPGGAYNCGRCRKCLMTMVTLEALGAREEVTTFPRRLDLDAIAAIEIAQPVTLTLWEDVLDAVRDASRPDLERPLEVLVASAKRELGLEPEYRRRRLPGPPRSPSSRAGTGPAAVDSAAAFYATPATAAAIEAAPALAILIGSYDGSGNFGDIAQLDAGLDLFERLGETILVAPVVERALLESDRSLRQDFLHHFEHTLYFDPGGAPGDDGLVPIPAESSPDFAVCYLYGGGYLNASWGARKLAMLGAAERLLERGGPPRVARVSSGLQVDADWVSGLAPADAEALRRFDLLGSRDSRSHRALARLGSAAPGLETGDDALGILGGQPAATASPPVAGALQVNVHFALHEWVTGDADPVLDFHVDLLQALGRGLPVRIRPMLAYVDPRIDERPALERLSRACLERGIALEEPLTLRPASLAAAAPVLRQADLTLSCSYHVALASLMLGVPATLLEDTPYYSQKAAGLLEAFGLPAGFATTSREGGAAAAERIAALLSDPEARADLEARIDRGAARQGRRRARAEVELLARIAGTAIDGGGPRPAVLLEAERREEEARAELALLLSSRSWRLAAPLRRLAARARQLLASLRPALRRMRRPR